MSFISGWEASINKALGSPVVPLIPNPVVIAPPTSPIQAPVAQQDQPIVTRNPGGDSYLNRAGIMSGASGLMLPPVGLRGGGQEARVSLLGR